MHLDVQYVKETFPLKIDNEFIEYSETAEHVGMVRCTSGNIPSLLARMTAHKKALGAVLHAGLAKSHRGNPAASIHVERVYASPVLFSGLGALVISDHEVKILNQHHKEKLRCLQRLLPMTPHAVTYFLAGCLPGTAILHQRQLSIFSMITRLKNNVLRNHALNIFNYNTCSKKSWFHQVRSLCLKYGLPHPLTLLTSPPTKEQFKTLVKKKVIDYWENTLREEATSLGSLQYFHPEFMSLTTPHPLWTTAGASPTKVSMATCQAIMLSGRYRTQKLCSKWDNSTEHCRLSPSCQSPEDITHIIQHCQALDNTRNKLLAFTRKYCEDKPNIQEIVNTHCSPDKTNFCQFLLDCSVLPDVIIAKQTEGQMILHQLFGLTRIWCFSLNRDRLKLLNRWPNYSRHY